MVENNNTNKGYLDYYIGQAIKTARELSKQVRVANNKILDPKIGNQLHAIPVYEPDCISLLSKTQEICNTEIVCVNDTTKFLSGYWKKYKDKSVVTIPQHNYCWTRYIVCKEIMHNYLHDTDSCTDSTVDLRSLILRLVNIGIQDESSPSFVVDIAAYYGALEYLMPQDTMPLIKAVYSQILSHTKDESKACNTIAHLLRVPLSLVEFRLSSPEEFES